jgi:hypothetical protein
MYEDAIEKLKQLSTDHAQLAADIESGTIKIKDTDKERVQTLMRTYTYWMQCCSMAAWLLEHENKVGGQP